MILNYYSLSSPATSAGSKLGLTGLCLRFWTREGRYHGRAFIITAITAFSSSSIVYRDKGIHINSLTLTVTAPSVAMNPGNGVHAAIFGKSNTNLKLIAFPAINWTNCQYVFQCQYAIRRNKYKLKCQKFPKLMGKNFKSSFF